MAEPFLQSFDVIRLRKNMRNGFIKRKENNFSSAEVIKRIENKSLEEQEDILIEDLLYTFQGIEGDYIKLVADVTDLNQSINFTVHAAFDPSIRSLVNQILPICIDFHTVTQFCDRFSSYCNGTVAQAFCSGVKNLLEEYLTTVCQFEAEHNEKERQKLSIQTIYLYVQRIHKTMRPLAEICSCIQQCKARGGSLLSLLYKKMGEFSGDKTAVDLCQFLLKISSKPYLAMLERWIFAGEIFDPYNEFLIRENANSNGRQLTGAAFDEIDNWEYRYIVREELCPVHLIQVADKILNCGKYLNIIFSCGFKPEDDFNVKRLGDISDDRKFLCTIEETNVYASKALVRLLINRYFLLECFKSIKRYFLIDQGDWLLNFLQMADKELSLHSKDVRLHSLESFLDMAIRSSSSAFDLLKDEIKVKLEKSSLSSFLLQLNNVEDNQTSSTSHFSEEKSCNVLKGIEAFTIKYDAKWPLSIIFNRKIMLQYAIIFRRLLQCKHLELNLSRCWLSNKYNQYQLYNHLLHEMMSFLKNYLYYATAEVLEPNWLKFYASLAQGQQSKNFTIDEALAEHSLFLDDCTKDCLLTDSKLVQNLQSILDACQMFVEKFLDPQAHKQTTTIEQIKDHFNQAQVDLLESMQIMSVASRGRLWTDIACRLDLKI